MAAAANPSDPRAPDEDGAHRSDLPAILGGSGDSIDACRDRPVPELGLGDDVGLTALLAATREMLAASRPEDVVAAVGRFVRAVGADLVNARRPDRDALPMDLTLGMTVPVLATADVVSVARLRLEQLLPVVMADARVAVSRLRQLEDLRRAEASAVTRGAVTRTDPPR